MYGSLTMDRTIASKPENMIKFQDLLPGIIERLPRIPSLLKAFRAGLSISMDDYNSIGLITENNASLFPEKRALLYEDQCYTHKELNELINRYANYFHKKGIKPGDVVGVMLENRPELVMLIVALGKLGAISSLINPNQKGKVLLHSIKLTCKDVFVVGEEMLEAFNDIKSGLDIVSNENIYFLPDGTDTKAPEGFVDLKSLMENEPVTNPDTTSTIKASMPFAYVFTSGTTGLPKASVQLHYRWIGAGIWFGRIIMDLTPDDTMYIPLPLYHTNGLNVAWSGATSTGAAIALRRKFSASNFWKDARKFNATSFIYIGEVCRYLINQPPRENDNENPIKKMVGNGLRPDIWKSFKKRFNIPNVYELYGAAEGSSVFTNFFNIDCSVGVSFTPFAIVQYNADDSEIIKDNNGFFKKVEKGQPGLMLNKITNRSPFIGYTSKKETDKKILKDVFKKGDLWFNTGDLMKSMGFGHTQFVDRLGDTFRWKGENVSTTEVEEILNQIDGIAESTVYGVSIPGTDGRAGMASIISDTVKDDIDKKKLATLLKQDLPSYAIPLFIRIKTHFDTTITFKIKKLDLKNEGFSPEKVTDPLYVLLPGDDEYKPLTPDVYGKICHGKFRF
jgi:citronellyl-CoA synthetase